MRSSAFESVTRVKTVAESRWWQLEGIVCENGPEDFARAAEIFERSVAFT